MIILGHVENFEIKISFKSNPEKFSISLNNYKNK